MILIKALEEKILAEGKVLPGNILKVDGFLNHRIDVSFLMEIGKEIAALYKNCPVNKILTIESSGIAIAVAAAAYMNVPVVFAKKHKSRNISDDVYAASVASFTHGNVYDAVVSRSFLSEDDRVLIVDDFLANGNALHGLLDILKQAGAKAEGCVVAIEKGFQGGGDALRAKGIRVDALACIANMSESGLTFR